VLDVAHVSSLPEVEEEEVALLLGIPEAQDSHVLEQVLYQHQYSIP